MSETVIKTFKRESLGSAATKKIRKDGLVPVVIYGKSLDNINLSLNSKEIEKFISVHGVGAKLTLDINGKQEMAIIKDVQRDILKNNIIHIELQHLSAGTKIKTALPLHFEGVNEIGKNLVLQRLAHDIEIEALPKDLINYISVDVSNLKLGENLTIADLDASKYPGIEFLSDADTTLASVSEPSAFVEPTDEESGEATANEAVATEETTATEE